MVLNSSLVIKILERLDFYVYFIQKPVHIEEILIKLNYFLIKGNELLQEHNEIWKKNVSNSIKEGFHSGLGYNDK